METMNRQHAVIAMAKIGRLVKQLRYWIDAEADSDLYFSTFDEDISSSNEWSDILYKYLKESSCKVVAEEFDRIGFTIFTFEKQVSCLSVAYFLSSCGKS